QEARDGDQEDAQDPESLPRSLRSEPQTARLSGRDDNYGLSGDDGGGGKSRSLDIRLQKAQTFARDGSYGLGEDGGAAGAEGGESLPPEGVSYRGGDGGTQGIGEISGVCPACGAE